MSSAESGSRGSGPTPEADQTPFWLGIVIIAGFGLRAAVALRSDNLLWPDEIFQCLEQAHRWVFGYGYVPWEFRFGARSWLVPGFVAGLLWLCKLLGLGSPADYIVCVKLVLCALSTSLIYTAFRIARNFAGPQAGMLAAILAAGWYELVYLAHKPYNEFLASYGLLMLLALVSEPVFHRVCHPAVGVLAGLVCVLRPQYGLAVVCIAAFIVRRWDRQSLVAALFGLVTVLFASGVLDRVTWGAWFETVRVTYRLNVIGQISDWFGHEPTLWYAGALFVSSFGLLWLPLSFGWLARWGVTRLPITCAWVILGSHMLIAHKEYRFVFAVIPLAWVVAAIMLARLHATEHFSRGTLAALMLIIGLVSVAGLFGHLPGQQQVFPAASPLYRSSALTAFRWLADAPDVQAVLIDEAPKHRPRIIGTGGYYYLHRDVPIYFTDELREALSSTDDYSMYASHAVSAVGGRCPERFMTLKQLGDRRVCRRETTTDLLQTFCPPVDPGQRRFENLVLALVGLPKVSGSVCGGAIQGATDEK